MLQCLKMIIETLLRTGIKLPWCGPAAGLSYAIRYCNLKSEHKYHMISKPFEYTRKTLNDIPKDLFDDKNVLLKTELLKKQCIKNPIKLAQIIKRMINDNK